MGVGIVPEALEDRVVPWCCGQGDLAALPELPELREIDAGLAVAGAEYALRLLPRGTHDWNRFLPPADLARLLRTAGLRTVDATGLTFDPLAGRWKCSRRLGINYMVEAYG